MDQEKGRFSHVVRDLLEAIANVSLHHRRMVFVLSFLLAAISLAGASRLTFDPELLNLIPQHNREINEFKYVLRELGTIDYHLVVLQMPAGHEAGEYESLIDAIASEHQRLPGIEDVTYKLPNPLDLIDALLPRAMLLLEPGELGDVAASLSDEKIREAVARNRTLLQTPQAFAMKELVRSDPFNLLPIFLRKLQSSGSGFKIDVTSGYYLSEDRSTLLILMKPRRPAQDIPFTRELMSESRTIVSKATAAFRQASPDVPVPKIAYTGGYAIAFDDAELIKKDIIANILFSFFGVLGLFLYAFRRLASLAYAGIPMALAIAMTFGIAGFVYGDLSAASTGFAALLAGLGIDFITVLYERYIHERNRGLDLSSALRKTMRATLPGVLVAAVTTAATFYAFLATDFRGMYELGFLTGTGILLFLLCVTFLLPSLIVQSESNVTAPPKHYIHSFGSDHLIHYSIANPRRIIALWILFAVVFGAFSFRLHFSDNIQNLRAKGNRGANMQELVTEKFGQSFDYMMYVVHEKTIEQTLQKTYQATTELDALVRSGTIASYQSISEFIPPAAQQREVIRILREGASDRFSIARISTTFRAALAEQGFRPEAYDEYLAKFAVALAPPKPVTIEEIRGQEGVGNLAARFLKKTAGGYLSVVYLYPARGVWSRELPPALAQLGARHPDAILTGVNLVSATLRRIVKADATRSTILALVLVYILMAIAFRSLKRAGFVFVPFILGCIGMLGFMGAMRLEFNFMNVFVGLMLVGVATDYAVYMLQRYLEDRHSFDTHAAETGKAVTMAALTSIVGFGSFAISHYPGLRSIGYAATFGVGFSALATITLMPAILMLVNLRKGYVPSEDAETDGEIA